MRTTSASKEIQNLGTMAVSGAALAATGSVMEEAARRSKRLLGSGDRLMMSPL